MKKIKMTLFIAVFILFLSGCDLKYNVKITNNLTTKENFSMNVGEGTITEMTEKYGESYINNTIDTYKDYFENNNYEFNSNKNDDITVTASRENDEFAINKDIMEERYKYYDFSCNDSMCLLYAVARNDIISGDGSVYYLELSIQVPYNVVNSNADKIDSIKNIYTWYSGPKNNNSDIVLLFEKDGTNIVKRNNIFYFIILGIFAIITLGLICIVINFIVRVRRSGRPR